MLKKTIRPNPDQLAYQDRGKMKWQGLLLSDHSEAIKKRKLAEQNDVFLPKPQLSLDEIGQKLSFAYQNKHPILIQTNILENRSCFQEFSCLVAGHFENNIYFSLKNGQLLKIPLENIRHLKLLDPLVWYHLK